MIQKKHRYVFGIDPGVHTGLAIWDRQERVFLLIRTVRIHQAWQTIQCYRGVNDAPLFVRVEDARKRIWFGRAGREQLQGAGSIKRDCSMWEDYLQGEHLDYELVAPKNNKTKTTAATFERLTGWKGTTSVHARDAGMLVFGF